MAFLSNAFTGNGSSSSKANETASGDEYLTLAIVKGGTIDGTLTVEYSEDDSTWHTIGESITSSSLNGKTFQAPPGYLRMTLAGATSSTFTGVIFLH